MKEPRGIRDFEKKLECLHMLLGLAKLSRPAFCNALAEMADPGNRSNADLVFAIQQSMKDWFQGRNGAVNPTGAPATKFQEWVVAVLRNKFGCEALDLPGIFLKGSIDELLDRIPEMHRTDSMERLRLTPRPCEQRPAVYVSGHLNNCDMKSLVSRRNIDQRMCYLLPSAAFHWRDIVRGGAYGQYQTCEKCLGFMLSSAPWAEFCRLQPELVVGLGGGSASKEVLIMQNMARLVPENGRIMTYQVVEYSPPMAQQTEIEIASILPGNADTKRFNSSPFVLQADFLDLGGMPFRRSGNYRACWHILGGTIGNVDEHQFFSVLSGYAKCGDFLLVGLDTVECDPSEESGKAFRARLVEKYQDTRIKTLLKGSLQLAWPDIEDMALPRSFSQVVASIDAEVVDGLADGLTCVPGSVTVRMFTRLASGKLTLAASTRYKESEFIKYAENFGFRFVHRESSGSYAMLAFSKE